MLCDVQIPRRSLTFAPTPDTAACTTCTTMDVRKHPWQCQSNDITIALDVY